MVSVRKLTDVKIKCPRCGKEGRLVIRLRHNSRECYVYHCENGIIKFCSISCLEVEKQGINLSSIVAELRKRLEEKIKQVKQS